MSINVPFLSVLTNMNSYKNEGESVDPYDVEYLIDVCIITLSSNKEHDLSSQNLIGSYSISYSENEIKETVSKVTKQIFKKEESTFKNMMKTLNISCLNDEELIETLRRIFDEMFQDNVLNWGRLMTTVIFSSLVLLEVKQIENKKIKKDISSYIEIRFSKWIETKGGWTSFIQFFGKNPTTWTILKKHLFSILQPESV